MIKYFLKRAKVYDDLQNPIPGSELKWVIDKSHSFNNYDEANIARISAQSVNDKLYIGITTININK